MIAMSPKAVLLALASHPERRGEKLFRRGSLDCRVDGAGRDCQLRGKYVDGLLGHTLVCTIEDRWMLRVAGTTRYVRDVDAGADVRELAECIFATFRRES